MYLPEAFKMYYEVLQEIKYMGTPGPQPPFLDLRFVPLALVFDVKDTRKYRGRIITNWDYKCNKVYEKLVINYATYYKHNTKKELYKMACDNRIAGRSHMNKKPLIVALMKL